METYFILLVKMRNLSLTYCFIEWNNMIWVEIYFGSFKIVLEVNNC